NLEDEVAARDQALVAQPLAKAVDEGRGRRPDAQEPDAPDFCRLLCPRAERPSGRAGQRSDERAALHSITSSATASSEGGTVIPSVRAVCALMTSSNLLDCTTGRSAGFAPLRMRPT